MALPCRMVAALFMLVSMTTCRSIHNEPESVSWKIEGANENACEGRADGRYSQWDVYRYMECKDQRASYGNCYSKARVEKDIYDAVSKECSPSTEFTVQTICKGRPAGYYRNPWDCHTFISCVWGHEPFVQACAPGHTALVFSPYRQACEFDCALHPEEEHCEQCLECPPSKEVSLSDHTSPRLPCEGKEDGHYPIADVFRFMVCSAGKDSYESCPVNTIFVPTSNPAFKLCQPASTVPLDIFCNRRSNGNFRNPWDCHKFIACSNQRPYVMPCVEGLVYDPNHDRCEHKEMFKCEQISQTDSQQVGRAGNQQVVEHGVSKSVQADGECTGKSDGKHAIRDVFKYLNCVDGKASYEWCPRGSIFTTDYNICSPARQISVEMFCYKRESGSWRNPWDCHSFIICSDGRPYVTPCPYYLYPHKKVFNPYANICERKKDFSCVTLVDTKSCQDQEDGKHFIRDVFRYLVCASGTGTYVDCPQQTIFDPDSKQCIDVKQVTLQSFCRLRNYGAFRNPWDCHRCIVCFGDPKTPLVSSCNDKSFSFNPYSGFCLSQEQFTCRQFEPSPSEMSLRGSDSTKLPEVNKLREANDECAGKPDGEYAIADVFKYLNCLAGKASYGSCASGSIFVAVSKSCEPAKQVSIKAFCDGRANGNWRNPWDCHSFISCSNGHHHVMDCPEKDTLVFDPYKNTCEMEKDFPCVVVNGTHPCKGHPDGRYPIKDVFRYMVCASEIASYVDCPQQTIYDPETKECADVSKFTVTTFCRSRNNGDWRNPWDCHKYITCSNFLSYNMPCVAGLVFDPYNDLCEHPHIFPCKQVDQDVDLLTLPRVNVSKHHADVSKGNPCAGRADGHYGTRNVFQYLICLNGSFREIVPCSNYGIYDPVAKGCANPAKFNMNNFCLNRETGNYNNPWNCHRYISCYNGITYDMPCQLPNLVYNPSTDQCVYPDEHECKQLPADVRGEQASEDRCKGREDGQYGIHDLFRYMTCKAEKHTYVDCPKETIYNTATQKCAPAAETTLTDICQTRPTGNYNQPFNCHHFLTCLHEEAYDRQCQHPELNLVYDPYNDECVYPNQYPCQQVKPGVSTESNDNDPCKDKVDGRYGIPDVFRYMVCKDQKHTYVQCEPENIYNPETKACVPAGEIKQRDFCQHRAAGNYRDPWDCHKYIACNNEVAMVRPCQHPELNLVYNPNNNECVYPSQFPCQQVKTVGPCTGRPDGTYPRRDVFTYLNCTRERDETVDCPHKLIYDAQNKECRTAESVLDTNEMEKFCLEPREDGNYRHPMNCHKIISCSHGKSSILTCTKDLVYNSEAGDCVHPEQYPCETAFDDKDCKNPGINGRKAIADTLKYIQCTDTRVHGLSTPNRVDCDVGYLFDTERMTCTPEEVFPLENICKARRNATVKWRNPWSCSSWIKCDSHGGQTILQCAKNMTFDPNNQSDQPCSHSFPCNNVFGDTNECKGVADGNYPLPRMIFQYKACWNQLPSSPTCPDGTFFDASPEDPMQRECQHYDPEKYNLDDICKGRTGEDGTNLQSPWNCSTFLTCSPGHADAHVMNCSSTGVPYPHYCSVLVYSPEMDACTYDNRCGPHQHFMVCRDSNNPPNNPPYAEIRMLNPSHER